MRNIMTMIIAGFCLLSTASAEAADVTYGVKFGMNLSKASIDTGSEFWGPGTDITFRKGIAGGLFLDYGLTPTVSIQPEILFVMKGTGAEMEIEGYSAEFTMKMNYITIPVLAKVTLPLEGAFKPVFYAGPSMGFNIGSDGDFKVSIPPYGSGSLDVDFSEAVNKSEFSLIGGAGFEVGTRAAGTFIFDLRYEYGMTEVIKGGPVTMSAYGESETEEIPADDSTFWSLAVMLGYAF